MLTVGVLMPVASVGLSVWVHVVLRVFGDWCVLCIINYLLFLFFITLGCLLGWDFGFVGVTCGILGWNLSVFGVCIFGVSLVLRVFCDG